MTSAFALRRRLVATILSAAAIFVPCASNAQLPVPMFWSAADLRLACQTSLQWCDQYVIGVVDGWRTLEAIMVAAGRLDSPRLCLPDVTEGRRLSEVVIRALEAQPETQGYGAASTTVQALMAAYPCPRGR